MKTQGVEESRLQLLRDISGAFRPGILTALVGVISAGKTTLMDVLAGRKTGGYIEGSTNISGYPKNQVTFARVSGYCEQNDIHSPYVTVYESLLYSAWLRLASEVNKETRKCLFQVDIDFEKEPIRAGKDGKSVYFGAIWPSTKEIAEVVQSSVLSAMFKSTYESITKGNQREDTNLITCTMFLV